MPRPKGIPSLRRHRTHRCGVVRLGGHDVYLGAWPDPDGPAPPEVERAYRRALGDWLSGRPASGEVVTVAVVAAGYLRHAQETYLKGGRPTTEVALVRQALRWLRDYLELPAADFGPLILEQVRGAMVRSGLCRNTANAYTSRIRRAWSWAASRELVAEPAAALLDRLPGLRRGRGAPDRPRKLPPAPADVLATACNLPPALRAMVDLQALTGMRPGEVCRLDAREIDRSRTPWEWRPEAHKTQHLGAEKVILFGPKARALLAPWLADPPGGPLFRNARGRPWSPGRYRARVGEAALAAGIAHWHPHQLRHAAATRIEEARGAEDSAAVLGDTLGVARRYQHARLERARKAAEEMG